MPLRPATAVTVAPGSRASDMIRSFCSADQLRRRSTVEMISDDMCLTVLKHVNKDSMLHQIHLGQQDANAVVPRGRLRLCSCARRSTSRIFLIDTLFVGIGCPRCFC